jgi:HK97 family phage major capsid protein
MDKIAELIAEMEALNARIAEIEERIDKAETDAKKEVLVEELNEKTAEFEAKEKEVERLQTAAKRADRLAELKPKKEDKTEDKKADGTLADPKVEIPDTDHNRMQYQAKKDEASMRYLIHPKSGATALQEMASKHGDVLVDEIMLKRVEAKEDAGAVQAPSWMRRFILPQPTALDVIMSNPRLAKAMAAAGLEGKASANDVLSTDAAGTQSGGAALIDTDYVPQLYRREINLVHDIPSMCFVKRAVGRQAIFPELTQSATTPFGVAITRGNGASGQGEGQAITESNPQFNQITISTGRVAALSQASLKEVRNADIAFEAELAWMFRNAVLFAYGQDIIEGSDTLFNNAGLPLGINTNLAINSHGVVTRARQVAAQVSYTDLGRMQFDVDEGATDEGTYIVSGGSSGAMQYMVSLDDSDGRSVFFNQFTGWGPAGQRGPRGLLLNRPYLRTKANTRNVGQRGDVIYGNCRHYGFCVDTDEMGIERSDHYAFNTGLVTYRLITYVGGRVLGGEAFVVLADVAGVSSSSSSSSST